MTRLTSMGFCAFLVLLVVGCASTIEVGQDGLLKIDYALKTYTLTVPPERCWEATFSDSVGIQLGSISGQGPKAGHMPEGAVSYEYIERACPDERGTEEEPVTQPAPPSAPPGAPTHDPAEPGPGLPIGLELFRFKEGTFFPSLAGHSELARSVDIEAPGLLAAQDRRELVGVGRPLPPQTTVRAHIDVVVDVDSALIVSSLPTRFSTFTVELNGVVIAEPGNGAQATAAGNGWVTMVADIPLVSFAGGNRVILTQNGARESQEPFFIDVSM